MKLEKQVCNLELSKKLKELGVKQESLWYWQLNKDGWILVLAEQIVEENDCVSAFTLAELGEMLPAHPTRESKITGSEEGAKWFAMKYDDEVNKDNSQKIEYVCEFGNNKFRDRNEANARAKMLIYLIENKLGNY